MLTLYLLRHAKSSWAQPLSRDIDRPLNDRGMRDAPRMGRFIASLGRKPDIILCSPAQRTRETMNLLLPELGAEGISIALPASLYEGDSQGYLDLVREHAGDAGCLLLIAHNPAIEDLADLLIGSGDRQARAAMRQKYPTAALAVLTFDVATWSEIKAAGGTLESFTTPAMLAA